MENRNISIVQVTKIFLSLVNRKISQFQLTKNRNFTSSTDKKCNLSVNQTYKIFPFSVSLTCETFPFPPIHIAKFFCHWNITKISANWNLSVSRQSNLRIFSDNRTNEIFPFSVMWIFFIFHQWKLWNFSVNQI